MHFFRGFAADPRPAHPCFPISRINAGSNLTLSAFDPRAPGKYPFSFAVFDAKTEEARIAVNSAKPPVRSLGEANRHALTAVHEPVTAQIASFVELFVMLLVLRGFFLPLFQIPTGSMAETLAGAYADHTCPNCGVSYQVGFDNSQSPFMVECPNCRWQEPTARLKPAEGIRLNEKAGDRIVVHGWPNVFGGELGPRRWDVVVFRNVNDPQQNYIKRLIGLPGETIEIIDGDIWATPPGKAQPEIARKTPQTQGVLWFPVYQHDYQPRQASKDKTGINSREVRVREPKWEYFKPRWCVSEGAGWSDLDQRVVRFDGGGPGTIQFTTGPEGTNEPGEITDIYGYNGYMFGPLNHREGRYTESLERESHAVSDVRLTAHVEFASSNGFVEFCVTKNFEKFHARLYADGRVTLERAGREPESRALWGETRVAAPQGKPIHFSIGHADYQVVVEVAGNAVLISTPQQYPVTAQIARDRSVFGTRSAVRVSAESGKLSLSHIEIDRDVYYCSDVPVEHPHAVQGHPIKLRDDAYMVFGDNSTRSLDSRYWQPPPVAGQPVRPGDAVLAAHLQERYRNGQYDIGTVPVDQMIGQAFLVYWPGFLPLFSGNQRMPDVVPDFGRVRWIR